MEQKNIIISLPIVWSIRNIFYSGLIEKLGRKYNICYLVPKEGKQLLIDKLGISPDDIIVYNDLKVSRAISILNQALHVKFSQQSPTSNEFFKKFHGRKSGSPAASLRKMISSLVAYTLSERKINKIINSIIRKHIGSEHLQLIKAIEPVFILSTAHVTEIEKYYFPFYSSLGYQIFAAILSFDNILSRGYIPLSHFDKVLVWNNKMKEEAIKYYKIPAQNIFITGSPQFDLNKQGLPARARLKLNLQPDDLVILYCANHYVHTPTEPELLKQIIEEADTRTDLKNYKWIIRLHPLDNFKRWDSFKKEMPAVIVNEPWVKTTSVHFWDLPSKEEFLLLGELLTISSIVLNMASTTTLDAIEIDKPVICIGFSPIDAKEGKYYYDCHFSEHFRLITSSGAFDLATSLEDLFIKLEENIAHPEKNKQQREDLSRNLLGVADKNATEMITEVISHEHHFS